MKKLLFLFTVFVSVSAFSASVDSLKMDLKAVLQNPPTQFADSIIGKKYLDVVSFYFTELNLDSAKIYLDQASGFIQNASSTYLENDIYLYYNTYYLYNSNLDTAIAIAEAVLKNNPNELAKATALSGIGNAYYFQGDFLNALDYYLKGLEIEEIISPEKNQCYIF